MARMRVGDEPRLVYGSSRPRQASTAVVGLIR
jgi:hypothetical protein